MQGDFGWLNGDMYVGNSRYGEVAARRVDDVTLEELEDMDFDFIDALGDVDIDDSEEVSVDGAWLHGGTVTVRDSSEVKLDFSYADGSMFNFFGVANGRLEVSHGNVNVNVWDSEQINIETGSGHDGVLVGDVFDFSVQTGHGDDRTLVLTSQSGIVSMGSGNDSLESHGSELAYNLGDGFDFANIVGGRTLGNTVDSWQDVLIFNLQAGGRHTVVANSYDIVMVDAGASGWWHHEDAAAIGLTDLPGFQLDVYYDDGVSMGKG